MIDDDDADDAGDADDAAVDDDADDAVVDDDAGDAGDADHLSPRGKSCRHSVQLLIDALTTFLISCLNQFFLPIPIFSYLNQFFLVLTIFFMPQQIFPALQKVLFQIGECICLNCQMHWSISQNLFV